MPGQLLREGKVLGEIASGENGSPEKGMYMSKVLLEVTVSRGRELIG